MFRQSTALALLGALAASPVAAQDIVALDSYDYNTLYTEGYSARDLVEGADAFDATGEDIGQLEDFVVGSDGEIVAVIAEVGGFLDIGDTHVSVPWSNVSLTAEGVQLDITEETLPDFTVFNQDRMPDDIGSDVATRVDDAEVGPQRYRLSEVLGDYARLSGEANEVTNYGYVRDAIILDGRVEAVIVSPDSGFGARGYRAMPYAGTAGGYNPYGPYYDMPYRDDDVRELGEFDYDAMERGYERS
ncbi:PRC-barrel domain-containing protein [Acuticoccus sp.]|uniref:PRC-barrel domain-containing protein n=1 Tax=Acuticoccus sp. TaxID=1904378 RepID=UPI003B5204AC